LEMHSERAGDFRLIGELSWGILLGLHEVVLRFAGLQGCFGGRLGDRWE
jgi:hypothetical protein